MIAAHTVIATCHVCARPVRSSITLHAELADLRARLCRAAVHLNHDSSLDTQVAYDLEIANIDLQLAALRTELRGVHLLCSIARGP